VSPSYSARQDSIFRVLPQPVATLTAGVRSIREWLD
jgi:hypothetical protein